MTQVIFPVLPCRMKILKKLIHPEFPQNTFGVFEVNYG